MDDGPVRISQFTDILCVWAYVAQARMDELCHTFGDAVAIDLHSCQVFGDTEAKVVRAWADRGGPAAYGDHVRKVAARFEHVTVHPDVWSRVRPTSSVPAHIHLAAIRVLARASGAADNLEVRVAWALRLAFFRDARDISRTDVCHEVAAACGVPRSEVDPLLTSGRAHAAFAADLALAKDLGVTMSPTLVFNEGRQRLQGNVGYRIIEANVRELMERPEASHSWC